MSDYIDYLNRDVRSDDDLGGLLESLHHYLKPLRTPAGLALRTLLGRFQSEWTERDEQGYITSVRTSQR